MYGHAVFFHVMACFVFVPIDVHSYLLIYICMSLLYPLFFQCVPLFMGLALREFSKYKGKASIVHHLEVVLNCFIYDCHLALDVFLKEGERIPSVMSFFEYCLLEKLSFCRVHDKRLMIVAINQLFSQTYYNIEETLAIALFSLLKYAFETLPKAVERRRQLEENAGESDSDEDNDWNEYGSSDGEIEEEQRPSSSETPINDHKSNVAPHSSDDEGCFSGYDTDDDGVWSEDGLEEELFHETPLDSINLYHLTKSTFNELPRKCPRVFSVFNERFVDKNALVECLQKEGLN